MSNQQNQEAINLDLNQHTRLVRAQNRQTLCKNILLEVITMQQGMNQNKQGKEA